MIKPLLGWNKARAWPPRVAGQAGDTQVKKLPKIDLVASRHPTFVQYLVESGFIQAPIHVPSDDPLATFMRAALTAIGIEITDDAEAGTMVVPHVRRGDLGGKVVLGILPLHLAAEAKAIVEVPLLHLTPEDRASMQQGDMTVERVREVAGSPRVYRVSARPDGWDLPFALEQALDCATSFTGHFGAHVLQDDKPGAAPMLHFEGACGQIAARVDLWRGLWQPLPDRGGWRDPWAGETELWRLKGVVGFDLSDGYASLRFFSEDDAWAAANRLFQGFPPAEGPHGVAAIVQVVRA
jgi:hypothetical protein